MFSNTMVYNGFMKTMVYEDNGLQWFYDVGVVFKQTHLKYGVFLRNIVFFPTVI